MSESRRRSGGWWIVAGFAIYALSAIARLTVLQTPWMLLGALLALGLVVWGATR